MFSYSVAICGGVGTCNAPMLSAGGLSSLWGVGISGSDFFACG
jgi:hypothetical protein